MDRPNKPVPPCFSCLDRKIHCHGSCERYQEYEAARNKWYKDIFRYNEVDYHDKNIRK